MNKKEKIFAIIFWLTQGIFVILRLFNIIAWKWLWVLSPSWGLIMLLILMIILGIIVIGIYYVTGVMRIYWKHWRGKL